jgi:hypothetical protein
MTDPRAEPTTLPTDRLWSLREAAVYLQMSESWVRRSDVPVVALGRARRYDPHQVIAFASQHLTHRIIVSSSRKTA